MTTHTDTVPTAETQPTVTIVDAGRYLGIGRSGAYAAAARGELPTIKLGRRLLVPTAALRRLLALDADR